MVVLNVVAVFAAVVVVEMVVVAEAVIVVGSGGSVANCRIKGM